MHKKRKVVWEIVVLALVFMIFISLAITACSQKQTSPPSVETGSGNSKSVSTTPSVHETNAIDKSTKAAEVVPGKAGLEKTVVGYPTVSMSWLPIEIAYEKGYFKDEGIDLNLVQMKGNVAVAALTSGDADYITFLGSTMRSALINDLPIRAIFVSCGPTWSVVGNKNFTKLEQLKGKNVGVTTFGASEHVFGQLMLKHVGLQPDVDIKWSALSTGASLLASLDQGLVDAVLLPTPDDVRAEGRGYRILGRVSDVIKAPAGGLGATLETIQNRPEQVEKFLRATFKGLKFIRENKNETVQMLAQWVAITPEEAQRSYDLMIDTYTDGVVSDEDIMLDPELSKAGLTKDNMDKVRDFTLVNKVRKELGFK